MIATILIAARPANRLRADDFANGFPEIFSDRRRDGVAELPCCCLPASGHFEFIWETLQPSHLADCEIPHLSSTIDDHIFPARDTVISSLEGLRWLVNAAARMIGIRGRARMLPMSRDLLSLGWIWKIRYGVAHRDPGTFLGFLSNCQHSI